MNKYLSFDEYYNRFPIELRIRIEACIQLSSGHPEISLKKHMYNVFTAASKYDDPLLLVVALFHDLGKLDTRMLYFHTKRNKLVTSFIGHERYASQYIAKYMYLFPDLCSTKEDKHQVATIILNHMKAHQYLAGLLTNPKHKMAFESHPLFHKFMLFASCDSATAL